MSVIKAKRKESQFEVLHNYVKMRQEITSLLLFDFGYSEKRQLDRLSRQFGGRTREQLDESEAAMWDKALQRMHAFAEWFIQDEREAVIQCMRDTTQELYTANAIYPTVPEELTERRIHQDRAVGGCYRLTQELQYAMETLPVDAERYMRFGRMIQTEINLIKGWRKSDNKKFAVLRAASVNSAAYFANVNNNGNSNYNNASNVNGVRPDSGLPDQSDV